MDQAVWQATRTELVPLIFMTSFARSGETMLLRALNAHPRIEVVNQILWDEPKEDSRLFEALQGYSDIVIRKGHPLLNHRNMINCSIVLLKHGIWTHQYPHIDFVLARNPFSIVKSLWQYAADNNEDEQFRRNRLARWAGKIDPSLVPLCHQGDETEAIARLYLSKMSAPSTKRLGMIRYEDLVADPERQLRQVVDFLSLQWSDAVVRSHETYPAGKLGHGNIKLSEAIRVTPFKPDMDMPAREFDMIAAITAPVLGSFGYRASNGRVDLL